MDNNFPDRNHINRLSSITGQNTRLKCEVNQFEMFHYETKQKAITFQLETKDI